MLLSDISIKRPVFATVISLLIIAFGVMSFFRLALRENPDIDPPVVSVTTTYRGASADTIEAKITQLVEDRISGLEGVRTITSSSQDGVSLITIEFLLSTDIAEAANAVRDRVNQVSAELPDDADPPKVAKTDPDAQPIIWLGLSSDTRDLLDLSDYASRYLKDRFSVIEGVAEVVIGGQQKYAMRIWPDKKLLAAHNLTVIDIASALKVNNLELPAGRIESKERDITVRLEPGYKNPADFEDLVVGYGKGGALIRIGDVAKVEIGAERQRVWLSGTGKNLVGLGITRQSKANSLEVAKLVKKEHAKIQSSVPEDLSFDLYYDSTSFIEASIKEVVYTLLLAIVLVVIVIYLFLGELRAVIIPAITVPISIIAAFIVLYFAGFSVNLLTLLGLVLAIGLVVDDSIVVLENIYSRVELGEPPLLAAYRGAREVGFAVIATTLVVVAVFVPLGFMPGSVGRLFTEFAFTIVGAVCFSTLVALTLTPMMSSKFLQLRLKPTRTRTIIDKVMKPLENGYGKVLKLFLKHRFLSLILFIALFGCVFIVFPKIKSEFAPQEDRGVILSMVIGPDGAGFDYMHRHMKAVEQQQLALIERGDGTRCVAFFPLSEAIDGDVNSGIHIIMLSDWEKRQRSAFELQGELFGRYSMIPGVLAFPILPPSLGQQPLAQEVQFVLMGDSFDELEQASNHILGKARQNPGLMGLDADYKPNKSKLIVQVDRDRAAAMGVSPAEIGSTLQVMLGSLPVTTYLERGEEYDVILQSSVETRSQPKDLDDLYVRSATTGKLIPLESLLITSERAGPSTLNRLNRSRAITISANVVPGYSLGEALTFMESVAKEAISENIRIAYKGPSLEYKESGRSLNYVFLFALLVVFLVMAAQFESWISPFVIMLTVPLALLGALLGLYFMGQTINTYSQIGLIMLIGLATKNAILIVEFANQLRDAGKEFDEALYQAAIKRFRPILMTALSTAIGIFPLVIATGAGSESRRAIGAAVFWGVLCATFFTTLFIPVFYGLLARHQKSPGAISKQLDEYIEEYQVNDLLVNIFELSDEMNITGYRI